MNIKIEFENSVSNRNAKLEENCNFINSRRADWDHLPYFNEELALEKVDSLKQERIIKEDEEILILLGLGSMDIQQTVHHRFKSTFPMHLGLSGSLIRE